MPRSRLKGLVCQRQRFGDVSAHSELSADQTEGRPETRIDAENRFELGESLLRPAQAL